MMVLLEIIVIVFGILQIILFFKIWGMTNNVKCLKEKFCDEPKRVETFSTHKTSTNTSTSFKAATDADIQLFDYVKRASDGVGMQVIEINNGKYKCMDGNTHRVMGEYTIDELLVKK